MAGAKSCFNQTLDTLLDPSVGSQDAECKNVLERLRQEESPISS